MNQTKNLFQIDFIGVGAEKTGSSWLFKCLSEHPEICASKPKETVFFDTTKIFGQEDRIQSDFEKFGIEYYQKYFAHCGNEKIKGEFTTTYLHDKNVAKRIYDNFPNIKIIINLRNPVEKLFAQYVAIQETGLFKSFEDALVREPEFIRRSLYTEYIEEYFKYFSKDKIFFIEYGEMEENPLKTIRNVYTFLGVSPTFVPPSLNIRVDTEEIKILTEFRNRVIKNSFINLVWKATRIFKINIFIKKLSLLFIKKPQMRRETRERLVRYFKNDIEGLEKITGRNLSQWKM